MKGQVSFEMLLITAIVFAATIGVSGYYLAIKDGTLAMQLTKIHALEQMERSDSLYTIEKIGYEEISADIIILKISLLGDVGCGDFDSRSLESAVRGNTKYTSITIELAVNGIGCP